MLQVDVFIEQLPETEALIATHLRKLILQTVPAITEKFSFKTPFYHYHGMFCYISKLKKGGIELCFCRGKDLEDAFPQLEQRGRSIIAGVTLRQMTDIVTLEIASLIMAAAAWQAQAKQEGVPMLIAPPRKKKQ
ncbi:MAG TPA: hypothetical protein DCL43_06500 [Chitinophagaceae bacterium]|nr:hypothetical protein [Chitinophagaceae bacterium]HAN39989.1 hypothetical protein [Chitinophagaceae bacterium]